MNRARARITASRAAIRRGARACLAPVAAWLLSSTAAFAEEPWQPGAPVPAGYEVETKRDKALIIVGAAALGASYSITTACAEMYTLVGIVEARSLKTSSTSVLPLAIPVAGPFVQMAVTGGNAGGKMVLALDGLVQTGAAVTLAVGLLTPRHVLVHQGKADFFLVPVLGASQHGLGLAGAF